MNIYDKLPTKTLSNNVVIKPIFQKEDIEYAKSIGGIFSLRVNETNKHFGNPFSSDKKLVKKDDLIQTNSTKESVEKYVDWIINAPNIEYFNGFWTREDVINQPNKIFLFGDNTHDRLITKYIPTSTQAVIRGLPNTIGIDTKKNRNTNDDSYFSDEDFDIFKEQVDTVINQTRLNNILFLEEETTGYKNRTIKNASADATIALAVDFTTAGEKLTKNSVINQNKKYIPIDANNLTVTQERIDKIVRILNSVSAKTINIAGNGIYTLKGEYTQEEIDLFTYELLKSVTQSPNLLNKIESIRSGGQTGFDTSGAKASQKLGIKTIVLAPKGWTYRTIDGKDISNEIEFKKRFEENKTIVLPSDGIGTGKAMLKEKAPKLFNYLQQQLNLLERSSWIKQVIKSKVICNKPIVYYKELFEASHANALDYLINQHEWL